MPFSSYSLLNTETVVRTFRTYSVQGDTKSDRYKGAIPNDLAEKAWIYLPYAGSGGSGSGGGGGISIFSGSS